MGRRHNCATIEAEDERRADGLPMRLGREHGLSDNLETTMLNATNAVDVRGMTTEQLQAHIAALSAENAKLRKASNGKLTCKVGEKGGVSVYGMGRFPVSLYAEQWARLFANREQIEAFIEANKASLSVKGE